MKRNHLRRTYMTYLLPTLGSMVLFSTYSMVDGIFVGRGVGAEALSAVNISMPFVSFIFAVAMLLSIGCSNLISYELGRGDLLRADEFFSIGIFLGATIGAILSLIAYFNIETLAHLLGAEGEIVDLVVDYLGVIILFSGCYILTYMFEIMVKADGTPRLAIIFMVLSAMTNIVLDYVFIYIFGWGIKGAAIATGISQLLPCVFYLIYFLSTYSKLAFKRFSLSFKRIKRILTFGIPAALTELSTGATITFFNIAISKYYGVVGLTAFSVIVYVLNLVVNTMISINQSAQPLVTYHLGGENLNSVNRLRKMQLATAGVMSLVFFMIVQTMPEALVSVFLDDVDGEFMAFATKALRLFSISFLLLGFNIAIGGFLTSVKRPMYELMISLLRGYGLVFLGTQLLPIIFGKEVVWLALSVSEVLTIAVSLYFLKKTISQLKTAPSS